MLCTFIYRLNFLAFNVEIVGSFVRVCHCSQSLFCRMFGRICRKTQHFILHVSISNFLPSWTNAHDPIPLSLSKNSAQLFSLTYLCGPFGSTGFALEPGRQPTLCPIGDIRTAMGKLPEMNIDEPPLPAPEPDPVVTLSGRSLSPVVEPVVCLLGGENLAPRHTLSYTRVAEPVIACHGAKTPHLSPSPSSFLPEPNMDRH